MNDRILGRTGPRVSKVGLGSEVFLNQDAALSGKLMESALEADSI